MLRKKHKTPPFFINEPSYCLTSSEVEIAEEKKTTVLTCPGAVGPVQIVTHNSLAKILMASTSIEGVCYADVRVKPFALLQTSQLFVFVQFY
jgi:hypothetical protein